MCLEVGGCLVFGWVIFWGYIVFRFGVEEYIFFGVSGVWGVFLLLFFSFVVYYMV